MLVSKKILSKLNSDETDEITLIIASEYDLSLEMTDTQFQENKIRQTLNNTCNSDILHPEIKSETENILSLSSGNLGVIGIRKISNGIIKKVVTKNIKFNKKPHEMDEELNKNDKRFKSFANPFSNEKIQEEKLLTKKKIDKQIEDILNE